MKIINTNNEVTNDSSNDICDREISLIDDILKRKKISLEKGFTEIASWNEIIKHNCDLQLKEYIETYNLPENSNWSDINKYIDNLKSEEWALKKKLNRKQSCDK